MLRRNNFIKLCTSKFSIYHRFYSNNTQQVRHKPPITIVRQDGGRKIIVACPPMKSNVNLSSIARVSSCYGVKKLILCGNASLKPHISRTDIDETNNIDISIHRSLPPILRKMKQEGYNIIGIEQTTTSKSIYNFEWPLKSVIVIGNEKYGLQDDILDECDMTVEIPLYGLPHSLNVSHALAIALYDYSKQYPLS